VKNFGKMISAFFFFFVLCSCASAPQWKYEKDAIRLSYKSDSQLNHYQGNPHTLMLCVYQLRDPNMFHQQVGEEEGLIKLLECGRSDPSVTSSKRFMIYPGKEMSEVLDRAEGTKYVGIVAGYYLLHVDQASRFYEIPVSFFLHNPKTLEINLYLGTQGLQNVGRR
jgi:type VI secretion system VasD/TssJ family lipoprotein